MNSILLSRPGAVRELEASTVPWHYGDPLREQKHLDSTGAVVERDRDLLVLSGPERLSWLHSITTQHLTELGDEQGTELLVLSPNGHIEHHAAVFSLGDKLWLDTAPGQGAALRDFLAKMRFFAQVEIEEVTDFALLSVTGPSDLAEPDTLEIPDAKFAAGSVPPRPSSIFAGRARPDGGWERRTDTVGRPTVDILVPRDQLDETIAALGLPLAGTWAYDTLRIPQGLPAFGVDTDHRTIPHEVVSLLVTAVHLDKGCYRGQETVARVHNLGKPPRATSILHLDGTEEQPPKPGDEVMLDGRAVGRVGTAGRHYEDGMIALALLRRNVRDKTDAKLMIGDSAAAL
ncbi:YgfZ/GcvT domain-containing protein [Stackebrandtia nassauensis]|uniref:Folate-binding protein YgfZ n=1 Tax=Stackebrandtia nassauensis (strain DSM 44728 / CIP 108903 / NRRL B-16338 / NBRC 102104 / LLR-40K-21) TaxID=446470 RepID=D3PY10_STANL|nr:folate-binding protein YgfZ [Stackebrandtia nassauensis]ADD45339.1 folate-binding protein YgfZ [Stackebrandtia nassauensis DSM 44728]